MKPLYTCALLIFVVACRLPEEKQLEALESESDTQEIKTITSHTATADTLQLKPLPRPKPVRRPSGIYSASLPFQEGVTIQQTVSFRPDNSFVLEERYKGTQKDSLVRTDGTWSPSDGFIWLYTKDQVVRGRYLWKGEVLQWVSPLHRRNFPMQLLQDASETAAWKQKKADGLVLFGTGTEPFWSVSISNKDTLSFQLADWQKALSLPLDSTLKNQESVSYLAGRDSLKVRLTVYQQFCSDGMSDLVYPNRLRLQYNNQVYTGCGAFYR